MQEYTDKAMEYGDIFMNPLMELIPQFTAVGMKLVAAVIVYIIGKLIAGVIMKVVRKALEAARLDNIMSKVGITKQLQDIGFEFTVTDLLSSVIKLILALVVWMAVINVLGIQQLTDFVNQILAYMPNLLIAIVLLAVGATIAQLVEGWVEQAASSKATKLDKNMVNRMGNIAKYAIYVLTIMTTINQLGIGGNMVETLFGAMSFGIALAAGLAFGLGGQQKAKELIEKL